MDVATVIGRDTPHDANRKSTQIVRSVWSLKQISTLIVAKNVSIYPKKLFSYLPLELKATVFQFLISDSRNKVPPVAIHYLLDPDDTVLTLNFFAGLDKGEIVEAFVKQCPKITQLYLHSCTRLTKDSFNLFMENYGSQLTVLDVTNCFNLSEHEFNRISSMSQLEHLSIRGGNVKKEALAGICNLKNLISFNGRTRFDNWDEDHLFMLSGNTNLKYLDLSSCSKLNEKTTYQLSKSCPTLEVAYFNSSSNFTNNALEALCQNCPNLQVIDLSHIPILNTGIKEISKCSNLKSLTIQFNPNSLDQEMLEVAKNCLKLEVLDLEFSLFSDKIVEAVGKNLCLLESLNLAGAELTGQFLYLIAQNCHDLKKMSLRGNFKISDESMIKFLQELPNDSPLMKFNLSDLNRISDTTLSLIATKCPNLESLTLRGCTKLTDLSFSHICSSLSHLVTMDVRETHVSALSVDFIRKKRPFLSIYTTFPAASSMESKFSTE